MPRGSFTSRFAPHGVQLKFLTRAIARQAIAGPCYVNGSNRSQLAAGHGTNAGPIQADDPSNSQCRHARMTAVACPRTETLICYPPSVQDRFSRELFAVCIYLLGLLVVRSGVEHVARDRENKEAARGETPQSAWLTAWSVCPQHTATSCPHARFVSCRWRNIVKCTTATADKVVDRSQASCAPSR
jgi:hypothetical protein